MNEYEDNFEQQEEEKVKLYLKTGEWIAKEAGALIKQYKECKTANAQNKLRPRLEYMLGRLEFEKKQIAILMGYNNGNEII